MEGFEEKYIEQKEKYFRHFFMQAPIQQVNFINTTAEAKKIQKGARLLMDAGVEFHFTNGEIVSYGQDSDLEVFSLQRKAFPEVFKPTIEEKLYLVFEELADQLKGEQIVDMDFTWDWYKDMDNEMDWVPTMINFETENGKKVTLAVMDYELVNGHYQDFDLNLEGELLVSIQ